MSRLPLRTLMLIVTIAGCERAPDKYVDPEKKFTLSYPASWRQESSDPLILATGDGGGTVMPSKFIAIRKAMPPSLPRRLSPADYDNIQGTIMGGLAEHVENARVESASDVTLGGCPARSVIITGHSVRSDSDAKLILVFCVHDGALYALSGSAAPDRFQRLRDDMAALTTSFQILQK